MAEIKREPIVSADGDSVTFDCDHTHSDILRYVINDVGPEHAGFLMQTLAEEDPIAVYVPLTPPKSQRHLRLYRSPRAPINSEAQIREKP